MKSTKSFFTVVSVMLLMCSMASCNAIKKFLNTDLSDEDYIVGQLYADEFVKETPIKAQRHNVNNNNGNASKTGIELNDKDNRKLYAAIDTWYGTPYQYGGCSTSGVDCSCFVGNIFKTVYGITLNRIAADILKNMDKTVSRKNLREGDVVFFTNSKGKVSHVGIYLKDDMFVHSSTSNGVIVSSLDNSYWKSHFYKGGRHKAVTTKYE